MNYHKTFCSRGWKFLYPMTKHQRSLYVTEQSRKYPWNVWPGGLNFSVQKINNIVRLDNKNSGLHFRGTCALVSYLWRHDLRNMSLYVIVNCRKELKAACNDYIISNYLVKSYSVNNLLINLFGGAGLDIIGKMWTKHTIFMTSLHILRPCRIFLSCYNQCVWQAVNFTCVKLNSIFHLNRIELYLSRIVFFLSKIKANIVQFHLC